jgi:hypothetical protein
MSLNDWDLLIMHGANSDKMCFLCLGKTSDQKNLVKIIGKLPLFIQCTIIMLLVSLLIKSITPIHV